MEYSVRILCPPIPPQGVAGLEDFKVCHLSKRPAFLKIEGGRLSEEGFLKEVRVDDRMSLYKGTWGLVKITLDLLSKGKIRIIPTETEKEKPITPKQKVLIQQLCRELNETHPIPASRRDASMLIQHLLSRKKVKKREVAA